MPLRAVLQAVYSLLTHCCGSVQTAWLVLLVASIAGEKRVETDSSTCETVIMGMLAVNVTFINLCEKALHSFCSRLGRDMQVCYAVRMLIRHATTLLNLSVNAVAGSKDARGSDRPHTVAC